MLVYLIIYVKRHRRVGTISVRDTITSSSSSLLDNVSETTQEVLRDPMNLEPTKQS